MLGEGHWKNVDATSSTDDKHEIVSKAWRILGQRGVDENEWADFFKWRGEAGVESGNSKPRPAQANEHEPNHKPRFKNDKGGGKGTGNGKKGTSMSGRATHNGRLVPTPPPEPPPAHAWWLRRLAYLVLSTLRCGYNRILGLALWGWRQGCASLRIARSSVGPF